jgi:hypothetical protein
MAVSSGPDIVDSGLVLALDAADRNSFDDDENYILNSTNLYNSCFETNGSGSDVDGTYVTYQDGGNKGYLGSIAPTGETSVRLKTPANYGGYSKQRTFFNINFPFSTECTASIFYKNDPTNPIPSIQFWGQNTLGPNQGSVVTVSLTGSPGVSYDNGWYRLTVNLGTSPSTNNFNFFSLLLDSNYSNNRYCEFAGFQVERGSTASPYYPTTGTAKNRGTTLIDLTGRGNTGTLTNGPTYSSANGGSIVFDGTDDYALVSSNITPGTGDFAVSVWVYKTEIVANRYIWDFGSNGGTLASGTNNGPGFRYYNPTIGTGGVLYNNGPVHNINTWYNIVISRISGTTYFYSNGSLITSGADAGNIGSWGTALTIGNYGGGGSYCHQGNISNLLVYKNKALSAAEIQQNFNSVRSRFGI